MMAQAARDPLWLACLTVADQDSIWAVGNANAGDLCIRCHSPSGWLEGRSDPTNVSALTGTDLDGVQCDFCHRMVDPMAELGQPGVPVDSGAAATLASETYAQDIAYLGGLSLFDGTPFLAQNRLPFYYDFVPSGYTTARSGQFFVDSDGGKRGPYADPAARHQFWYSRFHKSSELCATCHDVSNALLANLTRTGMTAEQAAYSFFHVERTQSEFDLSAYGQPGGAPTNGVPGVPTAGACQDCHMRDVVGAGCDKKGAPIRDDLALHDMTGGNAWMSSILASADQAGPAYDSYNYAILSGTKYAGASVDVAGLQSYGDELLAGSDRAVQQLEMAATIETVSDTGGTITMRVVNNTGHKLISGFPEGRRMFLNVKFFDADGAEITSDEVNPYSDLVTAQDGSGNDVYVSGGVLTHSRDDLVWETGLSSNDILGTDHTFHFALATDRYKDNRIPPKGFDTSRMAERLVQPRAGNADAPTYFTPAEYAGGYDEFVITRPAEAVSWHATLYYQTTSKEYIEFLRDEINGDANTLSSPTPSGEAQAYVAQNDPFFDNLKGWGDAIWDLWLHNGGAAPIAMATAGEAPVTCDPPAAPQGVAAEAGKRDLTVSWGPVADAAGYRVYLVQSGKYQLVADTTETSFKDRNVSSGNTYCYVVTAYAACDDGSELESDYSAQACATLASSGGGGGKPPKK
jgi:hypothetical protein